MTDVDKRVAVKNAEHQGPQVLPAAARSGKAADHRLLAKVRFHLEPRLTADSLAIAALRLLGEHPFQAVLGNRLEEGPPLALDVLAELNVRQRPQHIGQDFFTAAERQVLQVVAIQVEQIEDLIDERTFVGLLIILHQLELGLAGFIEHDDFTIEHRLMAELRQRSDDRRVTVLEGKLFAGIETHSALVYLGDGAIAVPLNFKEPIGVVEWLDNRRGEHRSDIPGHRGFESGMAAAPALRCRGPFLARSHALSNFLQRAVADGGGIGVGRRKGRGKGVVLLDQEPLILLALFQFDQREFAIELAAVENETQPPALQPFFNKLFVFVPVRHAGSLVSALIPDHDRAGSVVAGRDDSFEAPVVEGMIFDVDGQAFIIGIE